MWRPVTNGRAIPSTWYTINPLRRKDHSVPNYNDCFDQLLIDKRSLHYGSECTGNEEKYRSRMMTAISVVRWGLHRVSSVMSTRGLRPGLPWGRRNKAWTQVFYYCVEGRDEGSTRKGGELLYIIQQTREHPSIYIMTSHNTKTAVSISVELIQLHLVCLDENKCPFMILHRPHKG